MNINPIEQPALALCLHQSAWAAQNNQVIILSGMGFSDTEMLTFSTDDIPYIIESFEIARSQTYKTWRGFDVRHIANQQKHSDYRQLELFATLDAGTKYLSQDALDFITLKDVANAELNITAHRGYEVITNQLYSMPDVDMEFLKLSIAFRKQLIDEAQAHRQHITTGFFVLLREPFERLDRMLQYDSLRLFIHQHGMFVTVIDGNKYIPFYWSPEHDTNTSQVWFAPDIRFALDIVCAGIWRDACVVEYAFIERKDKGKGYQSSGKPKVNNPIVLPRRIYKSQWASETERQELSGITKRAHMVRGFYRELPDGHKASEEAFANAEQYGELPPPDGYTFVKPHERGGDEAMPRTRRIICRGLKTAKVLLS